MTLQPHQVLDYIRRSPGLARDQNRVEVRLFAIIVTGASCWALVQAALYIFGVDQSAMYKVAALTHFPNTLACLFLLAAAAMLPLLVSLAFLPGTLACKLPRRLAAGAMVLTGVAWLMLGDLARPLDYGALPFLYAATGIGHAFVGGAYAYSLNAQRMREFLPDDALETR